MIYKHFQVDISAANNATGLLDMTTGLIEFPSPKFVLGYQLSAAYNAGTSILPMNWVEGSLIWPTPRPIEFNISAASKFPGTLVLQPDSGTYYCRLMAGQFQIAPIAVDKFQIRVSAMDAASIGSAITIHFSIWLESDLEFYVNPNN